MWIRLTILCAILWPLGGCATFSSAPPSCDGMARRPLNRSLWDWEAKTAFGAAFGAPEDPAVPSPAIIRKSDAGAPPPSTAPIGALGSSHPIDIASYRSCGKES